MSKYQEVCKQLNQNEKVWLVTGVAGFVGSNLLEKLLLLNQKVIGLDNFSTGFQSNLDEVKQQVSAKQWNNFIFYQGDICNLEDCKKACYGVDYILHEAALGSVPRSIQDPISTNHANISGFVNMLVAAKEAQVSSFTYAASSSTYGDHPRLPKQEDIIGNPLSPYAVTKYVNELYANVFHRVYGFNSIGLRYFNIFGKRQTPAGAYAAVIPKWTGSMIQDEDLFINGDGTTSRDFNFIENAVQANILAATTHNIAAMNQIYNVAVGGCTDLNTLFLMLRDTLKVNGVHYTKKPIYRDFRAGDVKHSQADITKIKKFLGYEPEFNIVSGITKAMPWYVQNLKG